MSDPTRPEPPDSSPIADAAALFDSNVVHAYNPPTDPAPAAHREDGGDEYGIDLAHTASSPPPIPARPRAEPRSTTQKPTSASSAPAARHSAPANDESPRRVRPERADRAERASRHDIASDSSHYAPASPRQRSSDRAIGFDPADDGDAIVAEDDLVDVDPVWTRRAEWGPDLVKVGLAAATTLVVAWFALGLSLGLAFLAIVAGAVACALLGYPILITIERPVRITPEQAVTDFFGAASHHLPHYRRMWLLLSPTARRVGQFRDFGEFRDSWSRRIATWKEGRGGRLTPLSFRIKEFRGDKSVGLTTSHVEYVVEVCVRGHEGEKPINTYRMIHGVVKGPDRMWYLNQGTLSSGAR